MLLSVFSYCFMIDKDDIVRDLEQVKESFSLFLLLLKTIITFCAFNIKLQDLDFQSFLIASEVRR